MSNDIRIGSVCKCMHGITGIVTQITRKCRCMSCAPSLYIGVTLGGEPWQSKNPTLLYRTVGEYLHANYIRKFETEYEANYE